MKTDSTIDQLLADTPALEKSLARLSLFQRLKPLALPLAAATAIGLLYLAAIGARSDIREALTQAPMQLKTLILGLLTLSASLRLWKSAQVLPSRALRVASVIADGVVVAAAVTLIAVLPGFSFERWLHPNLALCWISVPLTGAPIAWAAHRWMRSQDPIRPREASAAISLFAGALGAWIYSFHCNQDQASFVLTWYPLGILTLAWAVRQLPARKPSDIRGL